MTLDIICSILDMAILILYFNVIFENRKRNIPIAAFFFLFLLGEGILYGLSLIFAYGVADFQFYWITLVSICLTFAQTFLYEGRLKNRIFAAISFQVYGSLSEVMTLSVISLLPSDITKSVLKDTSFCAILSKIFLFLFIIATNLIFLRKRRSFSVQYTILIFLMPLISIVILLTIPDLQTPSDIHTTLNIVASVGLLIGNIVNYILLDNILRVKELERTKEQLNRQLDFQAHKYMQISAAYRNTRSLMHDTKKHYFYIQECLKKEQYHEIDEYIDTAMKRIEQSYNRINTGNLVIDAFVSNHMTIAKKENIEFGTNISIDTANVQIDDYDFSVILGNLLDNSLEACQKILSPAPRRIMVEIRTTSKELLIHISNTVTHNYNENVPDELSHGYGTANINAITLKYYGTYTHYIEKGWYHAIVAIPCNI